MPQLDTVTYLSQLFWVLILFGGFYIIVLSDILPSLSTILKARKKKLDQNGDAIQTLASEETTTSSSYEAILMNSLEGSRTLLSKTLQSGLSWIGVASKEKNIQDLQAANQAIVSSLGKVEGTKKVFTSGLNS
jgi:hypothetical protein